MQRIAWPRLAAISALVFAVAGCDPTADHIQFSPTTPPIGFPAGGSGTNPAPAGGTGTNPAPAGGTGTNPAPAGGTGTNPVPAGTCTTAADCQSWETCSTTTRTCALQDGRCNADADCGLLAACSTADHTCGGLPAADAGGDVLLFGALQRANCGRDALSRLETPTIVQIGTTCDFFALVDFAELDIGNATIRPDGSIVYVNLGDRSEIRLFTPDAFEPSPDVPGASLYPSHPLDNDPVLLANRCPAGALHAWGMQAGTGALMYGCKTGVVNTDGYDFFDSSDSKVLSNVFGLLAWTSGDYKLVKTGPALDNRNYAVVSPSGVSTPVTGLPFQSNSWLFRTHGDAFWVAVFPNSVPDQAELWTIDATTAVATKIGPYADPPADIAPAEDQGRDTIYGVIDGAGVLYQIGDYDPNGLTRAVIRRPLAPDVTTVPYTEKNAPAALIDYSVFPPRNVYNRIGASVLVTRP